MTRQFRFHALGLLAVLVAASTVLLSQGSNTAPSAASKPAGLRARDLAAAKPEAVGMSTERLGRLDAAMKKLVDDKQVASLVTLVARHGKIVNFKAVGKLAPRAGKPSKKGQGFEQPLLRPHEHWHIDVTDLNICGTFYFLCSILDGYSRLVIHWEIRPTMTEAEVETVLQRAREPYPGEHPRIISDNGPQFIARDFKDFIRICGMTHVRTSPDYPQSNGKIERWHRSLKTECIRPGTPLSLDDARRLVEGYVRHYNEVRLHSAIGYVTPAAKLAGREPAIFAARDRKLGAARERRRTVREAARTAVGS